MGMDEDIVKIVAEVQRRTGKVYAWMVQSYLEVYRSEQTIRRDMVRLANEGKLQRLGERKGYRVATSRPTWKAAAWELPRWSPAGGH